jgi:SAM-dependent methyltransferase
MNAAGPAPGGLLNLDVGCGPSKRPGYIGVDVIAMPGVDVVHDLNCIPWPFADSSVGRIEMRNCLEHLADALAALDEIHRILAPGGELYLELPHFTSQDVHIDLTHRRAFSYFTFDYLTPRGGAPFAHRCVFDVVQRELVFWPLGNGLVPARVLGIRSLAHRHPRFYERFVCYLFPARALNVTLRAVK